MEIIFPLNKGSESETWGSEWGRGCWACGENKMKNWSTGWEEGGALSMSTVDRLKQNNSHIEAQVLLLLKEVVQDVLSDKVRV